jgi:hypothetical protein
MKGGVGRVMDEMGEGVMEMLLDSKNRKLRNFGVS